jgi:hypothetical protein
MSVSGRPLARIMASAYQLAKRLDKFGAQTVWQEVRAAANARPRTMQQAWVAVLLHNSCRAVPPSDVTSHS